MPKYEIERKFLLKSLPKDNPLDSIEIDQFYLRNSSGIWERVRKWKSKSGTKYIHTIKKSVSKGVNIEDEKLVSESEYLKFKDNCYNSKRESKSIKKIRHIYKDSDLTWEVDEFDNGYRLIVAEVEIPKMSFKLNIPSFIRDVMLMEVTGLKKFSNRSLSLDIPKDFLESIV